MQPCMRLLLLPGEGQAVQRKSQARDEREIAGEVHRRIHQLTDHAAGALHLARWRNVDAPSVFLQTGHGTSEEICQRTYHRQLHTDQRHTAPTSGASFSRRTTGWWGFPSTARRNSTTSTARTSRDAPHSTK